MSNLLDTPLRERQALYALADSDGWKVILAKYDKQFTELTEKMHNLKTPADEAEQLRQARAKIADEFSPRMLLESRLIILNSLIQKHTPKPEPPPAP